MKWYETHQGNRFACKLTQEQVDKIRSERPIGFAVKALARAWSVSESTIYKAKAGVTYKDKQ